MEYTIGLRCKMYRVVPFYFLNFLNIKDYSFFFFDFFFLSFIWFYIYKFGSKRPYYSVKIVASISILLK